MDHNNNEVCISENKLWRRTACNENWLIVTSYTNQRWNYSTLWGKGMAIKSILEFQQRYCSKNKDLFLDILLGRRLEKLVVEFIGSNTDEYSMNNS